MARRRGAPALAIAVGVTLLGMASACSSVNIAPVGSSTTGGAETSGASGVDSSYAVADPGSIKGPLLTPDVLITSSHTIPDSMRRKIAAVKGVAAAMPMSLASMSVSGRTLTVAAVDPASYRRFTPVAAAQSDAVWKRVADGEAAMDPAVGKKVEEPTGYLTLGQQDGAPSVHVGAYAPMAKRIQAVVDYPRGRQLGMPRANALLVSTGELTPSALTDKLKKIIGHRATLQVLATEFDLGVLQTAVLTGSSVSALVGSFDYTPHADGTVTPDPRWVSSYIRHENVPLIGRVTCNKGMLPQLRGALNEIIQRGLADRIHPTQYGGCYVPRYIANDPSLGLSLHSWGIAVDLNVPENQRGTAGQMDPQVVQIFKKWGFAWGGDWHYTDPMHFEMDAVVRSN
jgi:D-alanyl-D-alanine carboxypeptidase